MKLAKIQTLLLSDLGAVTELNAIALSPSSIRVTWTEPLPLCGIPSYNTTVQLINRDQCEEVTDGPQNHYHSTDTKITITHLESYSTYRMIVVAIVDDNLGQPSEPFLTTTLEGGKNCIYYVCYCSFSYVTSIQVYK